MKKVLIFAAVAEAATGLALLIVPSLVGQLLLGEELTGVAVPVARVAGIGLIGLGIACWPGPPLVGMLFYSSLIMLYLAYLGFASEIGQTSEIAECPLWHLADIYLCSANVRFQGKADATGCGYRVVDAQDAAHDPRLLLL